MTVVLCEDRNEFLPSGKLAPLTSRIATGLSGEALRGAEGSGVNLPSPLEMSLAADHSLTKPRCSAQPWSLTPEPWWTQGAPWLLQQALASFGRRAQ